MPADFHPEALKAQSVAARTYTWKAYTTGGKHGDGSVCTDSACCQAFLSEEDYMARGGTEEKYQKGLCAVETTAPIVLMYDGELIEATYFSCSGGQTEDAVAVWGTDVPYLQSVESPGEEKSDDFYTEVTSTPKEFSALLGRSLSGTPQQWLGSVVRTQGGGVQTMVIAGKTYTGRELRQMLKLNSTAFTMEVSGGNILVKTSGRGHRVGMSQYGADAMAATGSSYGEILAYYYRGAELTNWAQ
jgi:stage II sporulation protein D